MTLPDAYLSLDDAGILAARVVDTAAWDSADPAVHVKALLQASDEVDAESYEGGRYDPNQGRAFPRVILASGRVAREYLVRGGCGEYYEVLDLDVATRLPVVPERVKFAVFLQAVSILRDPQRVARLRDRHDGVAGQSSGGVSETYDVNRRPQALCREAVEQLGPYLRKSGRIV
jgi:hypothetical protein